MKHVTYKQIFFYFIYIFLQILCCVVCSCMVFFLYEYQISLFYNYNNKNVKKEIIIYDRNGNQLHCNKNNFYSVKFSKISNFLKNAFLAAEDKSFFSHRGISLKGIVRSLLVNLKAGKFIQGASTITQQYVKLSTSHSEKTLIRKMYEQIKALIIESSHTKEQILEAYLNILYFGPGIIGVQDAALSFFNCSYQNLSLAECATLAGIIQNPLHYNPYKNHSQCLMRRNMILERMKKLKFISLDDFNAAIKEPLIINSSKKDNSSIHCISYIYSKFKKQIKENSSLSIFTTFDKNIQKTISEILDYHGDELKKKCPFVQCAAAIFDNETKEIVALYNGFNHSMNDLVRVNELRQIGSTIKPLIMYYALQHGDTLDTLYYDEPLNINGWEPKNDNKKFKGLLSLKTALIESNNIIPIKILVNFGIDEFTDFINQYNFFKPALPYISLALGCIEANVIQNCFYISSFINEGEYCMKPIIKRIIDNNGNIIQKTICNKKNNLEKNYIHEIKNTMKLIGDRVQKLNNYDTLISLFGKTGTTQNAKTCWFVGGTEKYSIALYLGTDKHESLSKYRITSSRSASKIAIDILKKIEH